MSKDKTPGNAPSDAEVDYRSNLMEQQRAYDEFMNGQRNTQAIMDSLPAAKNIHNFDLNMFSSPGTLGSSIAKLESITIKGSTRFLYETSTQGTEARRGVQVINENVGSMAVFAADNVRLSLVKSMEKTLSTSVEDYNLFLSTYGSERIHLQYHIKGGVRNPFHLKARGRAAGRRLADSAADRLSRTFLGKPIRFTSRLIFHPIRWIKNLIGTMISTVATVTSTVISVLLLMALALFGVCLIGFLLFTAASYLIALFDFSSTDEEIRKAALNQIRTCYEEQSRDIAQTRASYRKTNIYYNSVKDYALYNEHPPYAEFTETTNSVEMLSMATVYFNFDLEKAGKDKVCRYIEKLYNGSHETSIIPYTYTTVDANGNKISYTDADITLTTYYFPALFDCELKNKLGTISGTDVTEQVWNYFMSAGFTEEAAAGIMGNFYQESGCDPTCDGGAAAGICMFEKNTGYFGEMQAYAASKGKPWTDLQCQLDFMMMSLPSTFNQYTGIGIHYYDNGEWCWWPTPYSFEQFKQITDIDLATEMFERVYERASIPRMERRIEAAHNYYRMYKGTYSEELEEESENAPETESAS